VFGWRFATPVPVRVEAAKISVNVEDPGGRYSTLIAVASGALLIHVRLTCVGDTATAWRFVGAAGRPCDVVALTTFE
jgi:hypothetical protein